MLFMRACANGSSNQKPEKNYPRCKGEECLCQISSFYDKRFGLYTSLNGDGDGDGVEVGIYPRASREAIILHPDSSLGGAVVRRF